MRLLCTVTGRGPRTERLAALRAFARSSAALLFVCPSLVGAVGWPTWRYDACRTACSPQELPAELHLEWSRELPSPQPCWPETEWRLQFDRSYEPVAADGLLFVPSMVRDSVTAYDVATGEEKWRFYADGPVRFAPTVWQGRVYFVSDDGYLYCLEAATGKLLWKFRGGPSDRRLLGNGRLISAWPARGAPVVYDGVVYFAASIWPFMGTFVHALKAETGKRVWTNSGSGQDFLLQPHSSPAFAGVAPQGYLLATEDKLLVAGGRSVPAAYDRRTGKFLYHQADTKLGGFAVALAGGWFLNDGHLYATADGKRLHPCAATVVTGSALLGIDTESRLVAYATAATSGTKAGAKAASPVLWSRATKPNLRTAFLQAGSRLYCGAPGLVAAVDLPRAEAAAHPKGDTASPGAPLVPPAGEWRYLAGSHPPAGWIEPDFDASTWKTGRAGFGYGDNDDATELAEMKDHCSVVYLRTTFALKAGEVPAGLLLRVNYDDAFIAYLNGREVLRVGVGEGAGAAATGIDSHEAKGYEDFSLPGAETLLRVGTNTLCVEGHNDDLVSSDFSLDLSLLPSAAAPPVAAAWQAAIDGTPWTMLAADGRLFVVTEAGRLYCFGAAAGKPRRYELRAPAATETLPVAVAQRVLDASGVHEGYCLALGVGDGRLLEALAQQQKLSVVGIDPDASKLVARRRRLEDAGLYGRRLSLVTGDLQSLPLSPYFASLVVSDTAPPPGGPDDDLARRVFQVLRPYGGVACFRGGAGTPALAARLRTLALPNAAVRTAGELVLLERRGPLPGAASWTHQYGDMANTVCSADKAVKSPLGMLWFGGPEHADVLPRHGHGPSEQVVGGRLFIEGINAFSARDVYTGRVLWRKPLPELDTSGIYYDTTYVADPYDRTYNQKHIPGANQYGSNFVVTADRVYVARQDECLVLDPATGETLTEWQLPEQPGIGHPNWGCLGVYEDVLLAGGAPLHLQGEKDDLSLLANSRFGIGSKYLFALDRITGKLLWAREAAHEFRHNCVVAGGGKVFCLDGLSPQRRELLKRRGELSDAPAAILALDARTGAEKWSATEGVFGTWLSYSGEHDILLQAGSRAGDRAADEVGQGMTAYRGLDGKRLWKHNESYSGPPILWHDRILTQTGGGNTAAPPAKAYSMLTGQPVVATHPLTDDPVPWGWLRFKGCNTAVASEHLLTFRSAAGCYADLPTGHGTTSIGGFKSGCTSNLIAADGLLNAPDYTRTCTCSYQNQADFALYPLPPSGAEDLAVESWSFDYLPAPDRPTPVRRVGLNFGAPGNRLGPDGTLWLEVPSVGGPSPDLLVAVSGDNAKFFRLHSSQLAVTPGALPWVAASGVDGLTGVTVRLFLQPGDPKASATVQAFERNASTTQLPTRLDNALGSHDTPWLYTVRLHFAETEDLKPGQRVFDVTLQGNKALTGLDLVKAAGGTHRAVVKEFKGVPVKDDLRIEFAPAPGALHPPRLCGVEVVLEKGAA